MAVSVWKKVVHVGKKADRTIEIINTNRYCNNNRSGHNMKSCRLLQVASRSSTRFGKQSYRIQSESRASS